ncbi:MAG: hypothetical protein ACRECQ_06695 [Burkholderiaceae bacterium]
MATTGAPVRSTVDWKSAVWSGLIAGLVFLVLELVLVPLLQGGSPWGPPRMIAAIGMGKEVLPPPATFDLGIVLVAMLIHFVLAIIYGLILALIIHRMTTGMAIVAGAVFGLALYVINFYGFTSVFPWFAMARGGLSIFVHLVFGIVAAWLYKAMVRRMTVPVTP